MKKLKELRRRAGLKQSEFAKEIGVSMYTVSCWERGVRFPETRTAKKICDFFHVTLSDLFEGENEYSSVGEKDYLENGQEQSQMVGNFIESNELDCLRGALMEACEIVCRLRRSGDRYTLASELMNQSAMKLVMRSVRDNDIDAAPDGQTENSGEGS